MRECTAARLRGNLSLVISCLALAVALSGTAYAVGLAPGSVDSKALAKNAVTAKKIRAAAVTATKIRRDAVGASAVADGSLGTAELADGSVTGTDLTDGSVTGTDLADGSVTGPDLASSSVGSSALADGSVGPAEIADGAVRGPALATASIGTTAVADRSIRLRDLGGTIAGLQDAAVVDRVRTVGSAISIAPGECRSVQLTTLNPAPQGTLGSMVVGTVTDSAGQAVVNNSGFVTPTLATATSQGGVVFHLGICAGASSQVIPAGSVVTWSLIAP